MANFLKGLTSPAGQEALYLLGASLKDIGSGGSDNFLTAENLLGRRRKDAEDRAAFDAFAEQMFPMGGAPVATPAVPSAGYQGIGPGVDGAPLAGAAALTGAGIGGNPGEIGGMTPEMRSRVEAVKKLRDPQALLRLWQSSQPTYERGEDGFYEVRPGEAPKLVTKFPGKPAKDDIPSGMEIGPDGLLRWRAGYVAAQKALADVRRDAIVSQPMPSRARGGGSGGATKGGGKPWERKW